MCIRDRRIYSSLWVRIRENRSKFYTKNMKAFVGYARRQAAKYGIKGSRLNAAKKVMDFIFDFDYASNNAIEYWRLKEVWDKLPDGEHIHKDKVDPNGNKLYEVCGKKVQDTATLQYLFNVINKFYVSYGERARQAQNNEGIDWKAVSHALRAAYQVRQILTEKTITFPLAQAEGLKAVKAGELSYINVVAPLLETLMSEIEMLAEKSDLPEKVDRKFWDEFIIEEVRNYLNG